MIFQLLINIFYWNRMANRTGDNYNFNETGQSFNNNPASLKGKLQTLEVPMFRCSATNKEHLERTQQSQEGSPDPEELERHPGISTNDEDSRREEKPLQRTCENRIGNVISFINLGKDTSTSKKPKTAESNNKSPHSRERRPLSNNNSSGCRGESPN